MRAFACILLMGLAAPAAAQEAEKELIVTITAKELRGGVVSEIAWDGGTVVMQGVFAEPSNSQLSAQYFVKPEGRTRLESREGHTEVSLKYWDMKSNRVSPTGLGRITMTTDTKMPQFGIGELERRLTDAVDMGGTQTNYIIRIGSLVLHERISVTAPYDGESWSWSPAEINRVAYCDQKGDLWIAGADGRSPRRILRGNYTLPAWSEDGRLIAVAERKNGGTKWEISVVYVPADLR
jgi:hypothetical protein